MFQLYLFQLKCTFIKRLGIEKGVETEILIIYEFNRKKNI